MEDLIKAAQELIDYIDEENVYDQSDDDGDGRIDNSQSHEFRSLIRDLESAIEEAIPTRDAIKLIKKCFINSVQTAIARQTKQP
jgi:hypothetical protein